MSVVGGEPGPVVEDGISVIVLASRQIIGLPRIDNDKRAQRERIRQVKVSTEENAMAHVESRSSVVGQRIVLVRNKARLRCSAARKKSAWTSTRTGIAIGIVQHVKAK